MAGRRGYASPETAGDEIYVAGQKVSAGRYRLVGSERAVQLEKEDLLPATCDGRVATYVKEPVPWGEILRGPRASTHGAG